jgi:uncharacterized protein (TIGR02452 family)
VNTDKYKRIADENEAIIEGGTYTGPAGRTVILADLVAASRMGTRSYSPEQTAELVDATRGVAHRPSAAVTGATKVEVTGESSMTAAQRLVQDGAESVAVLNFASARNFGGGYLGGARAQEEDLCRVSALYTTLHEAPDYYDAHRANRDPLYSHRVIYSPDVPVFRDERYKLLDEPYAVSFLTSPAPNAGAFADKYPDRTADLPGILAERAARVLAVAAHHDRATVVLGAWGCGVFRNDPTHAAAAFHTHLAGGGLFENRFDRIVFAVLDHAPGRPNLTAFQTVFDCPGAA